MSETKRKNFSGELKAKVALEAIRGIKTVDEIGQEFGVRPTQAGVWKKELLEQASSLFDAKRGPKPANPSASPERLHSEIGRLKMELDWLKKSPGSASSGAYAMEQHHRTLAGIARSTLCAPQMAAKPDEQELALLSVIDAEYTRHLI